MFSAQLTTINCFAKLLNKKNSSLCTTFSSKLYLKILSRLKIHQTSNFLTSHLLVNSNIWAVEPIKKIALVRSQTRKTIRFYTLEQKFIKFKLSFSSLTSVIHQVSHFCFSSFISLIRLEKRFRI